MAERKSTNNDLQNIHIKLKIEMNPTRKPGMKSCSLELYVNVYDAKCV
jgi:hypothetical protein